MAAARSKVTAAAALSGLSIRPPHQHVAAAVRHRCFGYTIRDQHTDAPLDGQQNVKVDRSQSSEEQLKAGPSSWSTLLRTQDAGAQPDLKALDELNPMSAGSNSKRLDASRNLKLWRKTLDAVKRSFTVAQLNGMLREAEIPDSLLQRQRRLSRARSINKDVYARALLVHRFGFEDTAAKDSERTAREAKVEEMHQMPLPVVYLVMSAHLDVLRSVLRRHSVSAFPGESAQDESGQAVYGVRLNGTQEGVRAVKTWLNAFEQDIVTLTVPLSELTSSAPTVVPDVAQLHEISRLSKSIVNIGEAPQYPVTISSIDKSGSDTARTLLAKCCFDRLQLKRRRFMSLAAPAVPEEKNASLPLYAMQTHADAASSNAEEADTLLRLSRQDLSFNREIGRDESIEQVDKGGTRLMSILDNASGDPQRVVEELVQKLDVGSKDEDEAGAETSLVVDFGHLLFQQHARLEAESGGNATPPPAGEWPVEHGLAWLRKDLQSASAEGFSSSFTPTFSPCLPPSAKNIEAHDTAPDARPSHTGSQDESKSQDESINALLRHLAANVNLTKSKFFRMLGRLVDFEEHLLIQYANETETVDLKLQPASVSSGANLDSQGRQDDDKLAEEEELSTYTEDHERLSQDEEDGDEDNSGWSGLKVGEEVGATTTKGERRSWEIASASKARHAQADVLMPDGPVDIRLTALNRVPLDTDGFEPQAWRPLLDMLSRKELSPFLHDPHRSDLPSAPLRINVRGKQYSLVDRKIVSEWTWNVVEDPHLSPYPAEAKYMLVRDLQANRTTPVLQIHWRLPQKAAEVPPSEPQDGKTVWQCVYRQISTALSLPFSGGRGYSV